jgi:transposase-like protein
MNEKALSSPRGRGPRITDEELDRMVALYKEGKSIQAIATAVNRHWQTVRKYVIEAMKERPGQELRREALKEALNDHYQDLVQVLASLPEMLVLPRSGELWENVTWQLPVPDRRTRLLLEGLREGHAKESALWSWWDRWNKTNKTFYNAINSIPERVKREIEVLGTRFPTASFAEGLTEVLTKRADSLVIDVGLYDPAMLKIVSSKKPRTEEIWLGESTALVRGNSMQDLMTALAKVMADMVEWEEVTQPAALYRRMADLKDKMLEEMEVLCLRRAFPGRCRLCPV